MALVDSFICTVCNQERTESFSARSGPPSVCSGCRKLAADCERREHFHGLDGLTIEERLRRIEKWIYDYEPPKHPLDVRF